MSQPSPSHIRATAIHVATLRRLALSVLFIIHHSTITTNSYQTTCTVSERTFNKRQHANARYRVELSLTSRITTWWQLGHSLEGGISRGCFTVPIAGRKGRWGQSSQGSKTPLQTTSSTRARKGPRTGPARGSTWLMRQDCAHHLQGRRPGQLHPKDHHSEYSRAKWH